MGSARGAADALGLKSRVRENAKTLLDATAPSFCDSPDDSIDCVLPMTLVEKSASIVTHSRTLLELYLRTARAVPSGGLILYSSRMLSAPFLPTALPCTSAFRLRSSSSLVSRSGLS